MQTSRVVSILAVALSVAGAAPAQEWRTWGGPRYRTSAGLAYDSSRDRVVLFGGSGLNDTWEHDGSAWHQVPVAGPPPRDGQAMAYDSVRGRAVMFGSRPRGAVRRPQHVRVGIR